MNHFAFVNNLRLPLRPDAEHPILDCYITSQNLKAQPTAAAESEL